MRKTILGVGILLLGLALSPAVFAGGSAAAAKKNPVVDVSALMNPGLWKAEQQVTVNGKPTSKWTVAKNGKCFTSQELRDFLNQPATPKVDKYRLEGKQLYIETDKTVAGKEVMRMTMTMTFDDRNHQHGTMKLTRHRKAGAVTMEVKGKAHRIGPCDSKPGASH